MVKRYLLVFVIGVMIISGFSGCKKFVDVEVPDDRLTADKVFSDPQKAQSAVSAIYGSMINEKALFSGPLTVFTSYSSDELYLYNAQPYIREFIDNHIQPTNTQNEAFWQDCYRYIYYANSAIMGIEKSAIPDSLKYRLLGECRFFRAFYYFYLYNMYEHVPLVLTTDYTVSEQQGAASKEEIYAQMILDLKTSRQLFESVDDSVGKTRINKWSATALLARVYLYHNDWDKAVQESSYIIDSKKYALNSDLNEVFKAGSTEAIFQLKPGGNIIPELLASYYPLYALSSYSSEYLINSFEPQDLRRSAWFDSTVYLSVNYKYPGKYKSLTFQNEEYYMVLRLSEQYLIRAEAHAHLNDLSEACSDLFIVRNRAGLQKTDAGSQKGLLEDIFKERRVELFAEWGHRWFDLKRTGAVDSVMRAIKPKWKSGYRLYPIPESQLMANRALVQNDDYQ